MRIWKICTVLLNLLLVLPAFAGGDIQLENIWARESPPMVKTGAAYLTITNSGGAIDNLLAVSGEVAENIEIHTHLMEDGVMKMRPVEMIEVPANSSVTLEPGGLHIMFIGLKEPLKKDDVFTLTFKFEKAGEIATEVTVKSIDAM